MQFLLSKTPILLNAFKGGYLRGYSSALVLVTNDSFVSLVAHLNNTNNQKVEFDRPSPFLVARLCSVSRVLRFLPVSPM